VAGQAKQDSCKRKLSVAQVSAQAEDLYAWSWSKGNRIVLAWCWRPGVHGHRSLLQLTSRARRIWYCLTFSPIPVMVSSRAPPVASAHACTLRCDRIMISFLAQMKWQRKRTSCSRSRPRFTGGRGRGAPRRCTLTSHR
jgi:hypothetical protein